MVLHLVLLLSVALPLHAAKDPLPQLNPAYSFRDRQRSITCMAQPFTADESKMLFGTNLIKAGYRPLLLSLENNGLHSFVLTHEGIKASAHEPIDLAEAEEVIKQLSLNTTAFLLAGGFAAGYFSWPTLIPIGVLAYQFHRHNNQMAELINNNILEPVVQIGPLKTIKRLLFIPEEKFSAQFSLTLHDERLADSFIFDIDLVRSPHIPGLTLE